MTDEQIMQRVKAGQLSELSQLFDRYHLKLYNFFLRLTRNRDLSQDFTQTVFERIIRYRQSFDDRQAPFHTWMFQIARNVRADHYRFNRLPLDGGQDPQELPRAEEVEAARETDSRDRIERMLATLKPDYREIILMAWFQQIPYAEIGRILNITEANVKVRMHRAVQQLRCRFNPKENFQKNGE